MWVNSVTQELAHTSLVGDLSEGPWQVDLYFPLREVRVKKNGDRPEEDSIKNTDHCNNFDSLFHSDDPTSLLPLHHPDTTFQPTALLKKRLPNADRDHIDIMYNFGRAGSPFCGFPVEDGMGSFSSLLHVAWLCTPLFTGNHDHNVASDLEKFCTLLQALGEAPDRNTKVDIVKKLTTKYFNRASNSQLQSRESWCPVDILTTILADFPPEYVNTKIGVEVQETLETGPCAKTHAMICIKGDQSLSLRTMMNSSGASNCSVVGDFFWVQLGIDASNCFCEPTIKTSIDEYYMLGFISNEERDGKCQWVGTIRDADDRFLVMDHDTCEPHVYPMQHRGLRNARLLLYGKTKPDQPTWLRPPSMAPGPQSKPVDIETLETDGLVTGSVLDLLTQMKKPNLQTQLQTGVDKLLGKLNKKRGKLDKLGCVKGWPMPEPNKITLVYPPKVQKDKEEGSTRYTPGFGEVRLQSSVTSPKVAGINLLVCFIFFMGEPSI